LVLSAPAIWQVEWSRYLLLLVVMLGFWGVADHFLYRRHLATTVKHPSLSVGLSVSDVRISLQDLEKERFSEISMRVFNGAGRTVEFTGLSGKISFSGAGFESGSLPSPTLRHDTARVVLPLKEWFLILDQRVPSTEADKMIKILEANVPLLLDLSGLDLMVSARDLAAPERLPLWDGVTYTREAGYGRLVRVTGHVQGKSTVRVS
jgi:hypothetical protein